MKLIDLNADLGESPDYETQNDLLRYISSANVACGGHAGDDESMRITLEQCRAHGVAVGAHPSYPDRANFGRLSLAISPRQITEEVAGQLAALLKIAREVGVPVTHLKPHGALYNDAAKDATIAQAICDGVPSGLTLYGLRGSVMLDVFLAAGFRTVAEVFADRSYQPDGSLTPRNLPGAVIHQPEAAAAHAVQLAPNAGTICLHSDTPNALKIAMAVHAALIKDGFAIRSI